MQPIRPIMSALIVAFLVSFVGIRTSAAEAIYVPSQVPSIQGAIDLAVAGDTVLVAPGTYFENIDFLGKAITVSSESGPEVTIIDGGGLGTTATFGQGEGLASVLNGFTIQNGIGTSLQGGGIYINAASPTITGNRIINNTGCDGVGIYVRDGSPLIQQNIISDNVRTICTGGSGGGGLLVTGNISPQILDNIISNNEIVGARGGGITMGGFGAPVVRGNIISGNSASGVIPAAQGGGMYLYVDQALIVQNLFIGNSADEGSAIAVLTPSVYGGPTLINNTFADNLGSSAIFAQGYNAASRLINNNIVGGTVQAALDCALSPEQAPTLIANNVFRPGGSAYLGNCADQDGINGNISQAPFFIDPLSGDYRLQVNSPLIDAGDGSDPNVPSTDFDGRSRVFDGDNDGLAIVDIGAFEFQADPVANAGPDQTVLDFETVTMDGSGSFDPEGGPLTYAWSLDGVEIGTGETAPVGPFAVGTYTITLTLTDLDGNASSDAMILKVNEPPLADAGPDQTVADADYVLLNGTGSFDPDGEVLTYLWTENSVQIAVGPTPTLAAVAAGIHTITLTVTDADGASGSDTMVLTATATPPVAHAGEDQSIRVTQTTTLDSTWSYDPSGGPLTYVWSLDGVDIATGPTPAVGPFDIGTYTITLTVTDQDGLNDSDSMVLTVLPPNQPPVADAGLDRTFTDGEFVRLNGYGSFDPDSTPLTYAWSLDGVVIATGVYPLLDAFAVGTYTITLTVTDADGASNSDDMVLTVHKRPVAQAGTDQTVTDADAVTLDGTASFDPDGGPLTYSWTLEGIEIATGQTAGVGPFQAGLYVLKLTVTDQEGATASDNVTIAVVPADQEPVNIPGAIRVPLDQPTIQAAVDVAIEGDTVLVSPGIYYESVNIQDKAITLTSEFGPEFTAIDGGGSGSVVYYGSVGANAILSGFTIRNGRAWSYGGGIYLWSSSPTISNNRILSNKACRGAGIYGHQSVPVIEGNLIDGNTQITCSTGSGGGAGIYLFWGSGAQIVNNTISNNRLYDGQGGGINLFGHSAEVRGNEIRGNSVSINLFSAGGGIYVSNNYRSRIVQNLIVGNTADEGGGIHLLGGMSADGPTLVANSIVGNRSRDGVGSALFLGYFNAGTLLANNIFAASEGPALWCEHANDQDPSNLRFNNIFSATGSGYGGACGEASGLDNISADPLFADPASGDYHPQVASPLIDAGDNSAPDLPATDFDGNSRIFDGDADGLAVVDMGAFEFQDVPVADAGPDQTIFDAETVMLDGSASFDPDGGLLSYLWKLDGTDVASTAMAQVGPFAAGSYTFTLIVTDQTGAKAKDSFALSVMPNLAPVANAGPDWTVNHSQSVTLDGTGSADPEGGVLTYAWSLGGTQIATGPAPTVGPFPVGSHTITLTVTDPFGASTADSVVVTVANDPPIANAGPDQTLQTLQTATLDGSGSADPEGGTLSYVWSMGATQIATGPMPVVGPFNAGGHTITLVVTDDHGASAIDTVTLSVLNQAPVANAGPDWTVNHSQSVTLDGTGSADPEGGVLTYAWSLGGTQIATGPAPTVGPFPVGSHTITLTVTDDQGASAADTMVLTVVNEPPLANAGPNQTANHAQTVILDGTGSSDPEGGVLTYAWSLDGAQIAIGPTPTVGPFPVGSHTITLTVTDDQGAGAADTMVVTVVNDPPLADAGPDQTANYNQSVMLNGTGSSDPEGGVLSYVWSLDTTQIATGSMPMVGPFDAGVHTITLVVTDDHGASATDTIVLTALNQAPIADAGPDQTRNHAQVVELDGAGSSDPDGTIVSYVWSLGGSQIDTGPAPTVGPFPVGSHTITLTVTDDQGASASDIIVLTVINEPPLADAGPDQTFSFTKGKTTLVTLDGSASTDPEGGIVSYVWTRSGQTVGSGASVTVALAKGVYTFVLTVTDDHGTTSSDSVVVTLTKGAKTSGL